MATAAFPALPTNVQLNDPNHPDLHNSLGSALNIVRTAMLAAGLLVLPGVATATASGLVIPSSTDPFNTALWKPASIVYPTARRQYTAPTTWEAKAYITNGTAILNAQGQLVIEGRAFRSVGTDGCLVISVTCPVIVRNCDFGGCPVQGYIIIRGPSIEVYNNRCFGELPSSTAGYSPGVFLDLDNGDAPVKSLAVHHNYTSGCAGIRLQKMNDNTNQFGIFCNQIVNVNTVKGTGAREYKSAIQLLNCPGIWCDISQNEILNDERVGNGEDQINLYSCVGTAGKPITVRDNYVDGARSNNLSSGNNGFTGTGLTTDLSGSSGVPPAFIYAFRNQLVRTSNAAMNLAGGHDISFMQNRMVTSGTLLDGTTPIGTISGATSIFDYYNSGTANFYNNVSRNNLIGFRSWDNTRHDQNAGILAGDNQHLADPITVATEDNERQIWEQRKADWKAADATFAIGNI